MSTASNRTRATNESHATLVTGREVLTNQRNADGGGEEGDRKIDPRGITKRLYVEAESSLGGKMDVSEWAAPQRAEHPTTNKRSRHPREI